MKINRCGCKLRTLREMGEKWWFEKVNLCELSFSPCQGFSCHKCRSYNGNKKSAVVHIEEECKVKGKEEILDNLLPFCRGNPECKHLTFLWGLFHFSK